MVTQPTGQNSELPIKLAILGAGNMGQRLAKAFQALSQVSIQYVYSRTLAQAESLATLHGAKLPMKDPAEKGATCCRDAQSVSGMKR